MSATIDQLNVFINAYREAHGRVVVLYHANCVDGYMSQIIIRKLLNDIQQGDSFKPPVDDNLDQIPVSSTSGNLYIPIQYEYTYEEWTKLVNGIGFKDVILVDFSPNIKRLKELSRKSQSVLIIDHHESTKKMVDKYWEIDPMSHLKIRGFKDLSWYDLKDHLAQRIDGSDYMPTMEFDNTLIIHEDKMCGAMMCWFLEYCQWVPGDKRHEHLMALDFDSIVKDAPPMVQATDDYDRYALKQKGSKEIQAFLYQQVYFGSLYFWCEITDDTVIATRNDYIARGSDLLLAKEKELKVLIARSKQKVYLGGNEFIAVNASASLVNDIGELLSNATGLPVAIWEIRSNYIKVSLRSSVENGNFDVGTIAAQYGGGGHRNAASFMINNNSLLEYAVSDLQ